MKRPETHCGQGRRQDESGFALLLVFLMAAMIAITMYMAIPRVAFDAQRQKEDLLIYRGEQYKRAIEVFSRANKRYPAKIEDLENTNNRHYLRRRYIDPMTGKDEWRAVHTNGMTLTDSKVQKQPQKKDGGNDITALTRPKEEYRTAPDRRGTGRIASFATLLIVALRMATGYPDVAIRLRR